MHLNLSQSLLSQAVFQAHRIPVEGGQIPPLFTVSFRLPERTTAVKIEPDQKLPNAGQYVLLWCQNSVNVTWCRSAFAFILHLSSDIFGCTSEKDLEHLAIGYTCHYSHPLLHVHSPSYSITPMLHCQTSTCRPLGAPGKWGRWPDEGASALTRGFILLL